MKTVYDFSGKFEDNFPGQIVIKTIDDLPAAEIISDRILISSIQDALDLMVICGEHGAGHIILHKKNLNENFFDLKTGLAGEILQKFVNYNVKLTVIGDFSHYKSTALQDFIRESNRLGRLSFSSDKP